MATARMGGGWCRLGQWGVSFRRPSCHADRLLAPPRCQPPLLSAAALAGRVPSVPGLVLPTGDGHACPLGASWAQRLPSGSPQWLGGEVAASAERCVGPKPWDVRGSEWAAASGGGGEFGRGGRWRTPGAFCERLLPPSWPPPITHHPSLLSILTEVSGRLLPQPEDAEEHRELRGSWV